MLCLFTSPYFFAFVMLQTSFSAIQAFLFSSNWFCPLFAPNLFLPLCSVYLFHHISLFLSCCRLLFQRSNFSCFLQIGFALYLRRIFFFRYALSIYFTIFLCFCHVADFFFSLDVLDIAFLLSSPPADLDYSICFILLLTVKKYLFVCMIALSIFL